SGRVIQPDPFLPRLMGALRLWSSSETHSVRLVVAKIQYLDDQWRPTKLEDSRTEESFRFTTSRQRMSRPRAGGDPRARRKRSPLRRSSPGSARDSASRSATFPLLTGRDVQFRRIDREPVKREVSQHASDGIFDRSPSRMAMADLRLRGRDHRG